MNRFVFSGDSEGAILVWRPDRSTGDGWYQLLRRLRKGDLDGRSITSLCMFPKKSRSQMLVLAQPGIFRLYDLSKYKVETSYPGLNIGNSFSRAQFSADGKFALCSSEDTRAAPVSTSGGSSSGEGGGGGGGGGGEGSTALGPMSSPGLKPKPSRLRVWDSQLGITVSVYVSVFVCVEYNLFLHFPKYVFFVSLHLLSSLPFLLTGNILYIR